MLNKISGLFLLGLTVCSSALAEKDSININGAELYDDAGEDYINVSFETKPSLSIIAGEIAIVCPARWKINHVVMKSSGNPVGELISVDKIPDSILRSIEIRGVRFSYSMVEPKEREFHNILCDPGVFHNPVDSRYSFTVAESPKWSEAFYNLYSNSLYDEKYLSESLAKAFVSKKPVFATDKFDNRVFMLASSKTHMTKGTVNLNGFKRWVAENTKSKAKSTYKADVSGASVPVQNVKTSANVSAILMIDTSGSMKGDRLREAKSSARKFIRETTSSGGEIAIMAFSGSCESPRVKHHSFSSQSNSLIQFVNSLVADGGTPLSPAVEVANVFMANYASDHAITKNIFLMADGQDNCGKMTKVTNSLKSKGILYPHYTLGVELDGSAAADQLSALARKSEGRYFSVNNVRDISRVMEDLEFSEGIDQMINGTPSHSSSPSSSSSIYDGFE